jgi:hypothetical protein
MPDPQLLLMAKDMRARAEELLARANTFNDAGAREGIRRIAAGYQKLADRLERRAGDEP